MHNFKFINIRLESNTKILLNIFVHLIWKWIMSMMCWWIRSLQVLMNVSFHFFTWYIFDNEIVNAFIFFGIKIDKNQFSIRKTGYNSINYRSAKSIKYNYQNLLNQWHTSVRYGFRKHFLDARVLNLNTKFFWIDSADSDEYT